MDLTLHAALSAQAARRPERIAVHCQDRTVTYAELYARALRTAAALHEAGVRPGDRVAHLARDSEHYYVLLFACAMTGAVLVPVNWRLGGEEIEHILRDSDARLLFADTAHDGIPTVPPGWAEAAGEPPRFEATADTPVVQIYTSGTTGLPKGVVLAHRTFFAVRAALDSEGLDWIDWRDDDISLICVPGFHVGGLWWAAQGFAAGVTNVVMPAFTGGTAVELVRTHRATTTCVVPAMLQMMLSESPEDPASLRSLRKVVYGGAPISETLLRQGLDRIGADFAQIYGLTETGNTACCLPPSEHVPGSPRLAAAGRPYPGFAVRITDERGAPLPVGEVGEVRLRTGARMLGYHGRPEATEETLQDGWIVTGDAGYLDEEGYLYLCDRIKDTIIVAGENVYPAAVENALAAHPAVREAAAVAVPDERWGEAVHAFVVLEPGAAATPRELMLALRGRLADFQLPAGYTFVPSLPRNASGKILRRELRQPYWVDRQRQVN
ncbi:AMP-binding protein [Streptomyces ardesiacus]|uniref:AMP-binding protein n=1 Tax=Streptomyces ardesiacus TaxID=285564 RepID=UPI0006E20363|nr:AMP-binding protein [Streptomyces sp. NBRC 110030]